MVLVEKVTGIRKLDSDMFNSCPIDRFGGSGGAAFLWQPIRCPRFPKAFIKKYRVFGNYLSEWVSPFPSGLKLGPAVAMGNLWML
jgi:hypothetical protein